MSAEQSERNIYAELSHVRLRLRKKRIVKENLRAMLAKEVAIRNQYKERWPSTPPPDASVRNWTPLERVVFVNEFRRWNNNHPQCSDFRLNLPPLVKRIYCVEQWCRAPKDKAPPLASGNTEPTIASELARFRSRKEERAAKLLQKAAKSAGQRTLRGFMPCPTQHQRPSLLHLELCNIVQLQSRTPIEIQT